MAWRIPGPAARQVVVLALMPALTPVRDAPWAIYFGTLGQTTCVGLEARLYATPNPEEFLLACKDRDQAPVLMELQSRFGFVRNRAQGGIGG